MIDYYSLAPLNSILNAIAAVLLTAGFIFIRKRQVRAHRACMLSAVVVSTAFFISYITYHYHVGDVRFQGHGIVRPIYFTILITHVILAAAIVPLVLITLWRAHSGNFSRHRRIARWTWPIWMYVSITGVVVYVMCYRMYPPGYNVAPPATSSASIAPPTATAAIPIEVTLEDSGGDPGGVKTPRRRRMMPARRLGFADPALSSMADWSYK
jgi:putative membrane protein